MFIYLHIQVWGWLRGLSDLTSDKQTNRCEAFLTIKHPRPHGDCPGRVPVGGFLGRGGLLIGRFFRGSQWATVWSTQVRAFDDRVFDGLYATKLRSPSCATNKDICPVVKHNYLCSSETAAVVQGEAMRFEPPHSWSTIRMPPTPACAPSTAVFLLQIPGVWHCSCDNERSAEYILLN